MLKICRDKWNKNSKKLENTLRYDSKLNSYDYAKLVEITFDIIFNDDSNEYGEDLNVALITEIDNGDYQGTLLYLIPFETYQPSEYQYLMTYVGYGTCSGCDTLESIRAYGDYDNFVTEKQLKDYMMLCKDIITNTIKPYNYGWRSDERYEVIE